MRGIQWRSNKIEITVHSAIHAVHVTLLSTAHQFYRAAPPHPILRVFEEGALTVWVNNRGSFGPEILHVNRISSKLVHRHIIFPLIPLHAVEQ